MACYNCGGALYHLFHTSAAVAQEVAAVNPATEAKRGLDISAIFYDTSSQQNKKNAKETIQSPAIAQHYYESPPHSIHNIRRYHRDNYRHHYYRHSSGKKQQKEISKSIETVRQVNYSGNMKLGEIAHLAYIGEGEEEKTRKYGRDKDYSPKNGYKPKVKSGKEKRGKNKGVEIAVSKLEVKSVVSSREEHKIEKIGKARKKKASTQINPNRGIDLLVLEELIRRAYLNKQKIAIGSS